jgi:hypothetical protein
VRGIVAIRKGKEFGGRLAVDAGEVISDILVYVAVEMD